MTRGARMIVPVFWACALGMPQDSFAQACDQALSVGANIAAAVSAAPNAWTICLNSGNFGTVNLTNITRSGFVTLRSTNGVGALMSPQVRNTHFVRFVSMTLDAMNIVGCSTNIQVLNSRFSVTEGLGINNYNDTCTNYPMNVLIDGTYFGNVSPSFSEGRLDIRDKDVSQGNMGITVINSRFDGEGGCASDGVQFSGQPAGVTIGPGNIFQNIIQSGPVHCDGIQIVSSGPNVVITGNWFRNSSVALRAHDGDAPSVRFTSNVITNVDQLAVAESVAAGFVFEHNTVYNLTDVFNIGGSSRNVTGRSNIFIGNTTKPTICATGCIYSHNLCQSSGQCAGTNQTIGTPMFVGGAPGSIATFAGWQLAAGSPGKGDGHEGRDRGTLYYGASAPPAPTNLRIVRE